MHLALRGERQVFACQDPDHVHSRAVSCTRRRFLGAFAGLGAAALLVDRPAGAQTADKPFRIDVHHHLSSPGFIAEISGRRTGQVPLMKWTVAQSLEDMDHGGVATSILSISEPSVFFGNLPTILAGSGCSRPCRFPTLTVPCARSNTRSIR